MDDRPSQVHESDLFSHVSLNTARALCMSAGDWSALTAREVSRVLAKEHNRRPEAFATGFDELTDRGAITSSDASTLKQLTKSAFSAIREKADIDTCRTEILGCYGKLCADREASPAALAIASTAIRALDLHSASSGKAREVSLGGAIGFGVGGALLGAGIGSAFGPIGAGVGGLIGGAVGVGVSISNDTGT